MKILFLTNIASPYRVNFFNYLSRECNLKVVFDNYTSIDRNENWFKENNIGFDYCILGKKWITNLKKILDEKYDIIVIGTYATRTSALARFILKYKKIPYVISADGGFVQDKNFITKFVKKFFISSASYWLSSGKKTTEYLTYYGANMKNTFEFPFTSVMTEDLLYSPINYSEKMKLRNNRGYNYTRLFISVGNFIYRKGYDIFLEMINDYRINDNIGFLIIGGGIKEKEYNDYLKKNNIRNVHFLKFCSKEEILELYKMCDVFFFPSREDIWGLVINEALACGLPIISSDNVIASLELVSKNNLYNCNDKERMYELFNTYINKKYELILEEGTRNLVVANEYTIEKMVSRHIEIFENIIEKKGPSDI